MSDAWMFLSPGRSAPLLKANDLCRSRGVEWSIRPHCVDAEKHPNCTASYSGVLLGWTSGASWGKALPKSYSCFFFHIINSSGKMRVAFSVRSAEKAARRIQYHNKPSRLVIGTIFFKIFLYSCNQTRSIIQISSFPWNKKGVFNIMFPTS